MGIEFIKNAILNLKNFLKKYNLKDDTVSESELEENITSK